MNLMNCLGSNKHPPQIDIRKTLFLYILLGEMADVQT